MLSFLDPVLFPDNYQIYELTPNQFVYPIYKSGSTTIAKTAMRLLPYHEHRDLKVVDIYLRDPFERYVSGVQMYLKLHPDLDRETALKFIEELLFLNNHFSLQFHWIVNLARFTNAKFHLRRMDELKSTTDEIWNTLSRDQTLMDRFGDNKKLKFYLQLDKILYEDCIGKTVQLKSIVNHIRTSYTELYAETIERSKELCGVLG
jgi:hypothetical protein